MTKEIHQFVHTLTYGDAISVEALALRRALREQGAQSEIYALNVHPRFKGDVHFVADFLKKFGHNSVEPSNTLKNADFSVAAKFTGEAVLHYSLGSPLNDLFRGLTAAKRSLIYHNITPAEWFEDVNPRVANDIIHGIKDLEPICRTATRVIADSRFNAQELESLGITAQVLPLLVDPARWVGGVNGGIDALLKGDDSKHLIHVGRIAPNKCIEDVIKVFYFFRNFVEPKSKLWLIGTDVDTELYSFGLRQLVTKLCLDDYVKFTGPLSDEEVQAFYKNGDVYLCMSEHEGFCLPVIEAMHFGCPVVGFAAGAVPETLGAGAVLVKEKRHAEIAELLGQICNDADLRQKILAAGKDRVADFSYDKFRSNVKELFFHQSVGSFEISAQTEASL